MTLVSVHNRQSGQPDRLAMFRSKHCGANETRVGIQDDVQRHGRKHPSSGCFARNARKKTPVVSAGRIFGAMPPPMKTPPVATVLRREVAGFGAIRTDEQVERIGAPSARAGQPRCRNLRRRIHIVQIDRRGACLPMHRPVHVDQSASRHDVLHFGAIVSSREVAQQIDLALGAGWKIGVTAFRRREDEPARRSL